MKRRYVAYVESKPAGGFSAFFPDLDDCAIPDSWTIEEVKDAAHKALKKYLKAKIGAGEYVRPPGQYENAVVLEALETYLEIIVEF